MSLRSEHGCESESGQLLLPAMALVLVAIAATIAIVSIASIMIARSELQQAADIAAQTLTTASGDTPHARAVALARANGASRVKISDGPQADQLRVDVWGPAPKLVGIASVHDLHVHRTVLVVSVTSGMNTGNATGAGGGYAGSLMRVDAARICPAVGARFVAMQHAAARDGISFPAVSGFRSYAEQASLYASLGPRIAAPPGRSLHHQATELDLSVGSSGSPAHVWLTHHASQWSFTQRYSWEPWHWGNTQGC